jgi:hypothetical protein
MLTSSLACFLFGGLVSSAALPESVSRSTSSKNTTGLGTNDVLIFGNDGRVEVWSKERYDALVSLDLTSATPLSQTAPRNTTTISERNPELNARACKWNTVIVPNEDQTFLDWDKPMTSVVHTTASTASVQISTGYSLSNSVSVSNSADLTLVKDFLSVSFSFKYSQTWTTTTTSAYTFDVPVGSFGAIVSNPRTLRKTGTVWKGCIGSAEASTYQADSYSSQSYNDLAWVTGTISLCTGTTYPLPMCVGSGVLHWVMNCGDVEGR